MGTQRFARQRERKLAVFPFEQPSTKRVLQSTNASTNRRLTDAQSLGGPVESAVRRNRKKRFKLQYFHGGRTSLTFILDVPIEIVYHCDNYNPFD
jgi:hypothetical protein